MTVPGNVLQVKVKVILYEILYLYAKFQKCILLLRESAQITQPF